MNSFDLKVTRPQVLMVVNIAAIVIAEFFVATALKRALAKEAGSGGHRG
jgi:hypothetical protein